jgi:hypothetical protein
MKLESNYTDSISLNVNNVANFALATISTTNFNLNNIKSAG